MMFKTTSELHQKKAGPMEFDLIHVFIVSKVLIIVTDQGAYSHALKDVFLFVQ